MRLITCFSIFIFLLASCTSADKKLVLDDGGTVLSGIVCGTESYTNMYATYRCDTLELESSNEYIDQASPLHNIEGVVVKRQQKLLVLEDRIFNPSVSDKDESPNCVRRLRVILNPGTGPGVQYQAGWLTFRPNCMTFNKIKSTRDKVGQIPFISHSNHP